MIKTTLLWLLSLFSQKYQRHIKFNLAIIRSLGKFRKFWKFMVLEEKLKLYGKNRIWQKVYTLFIRFSFLLV